MITSKTIRKIEELADSDGFNNCNTKHSLLEIVKRATFEGVPEDLAVNIISRVYQVVSEELS
jgi:hypothetical protein